MRIGIDARFFGILGKGLGRYTEQLILGLERSESQDEYFIFLRRENFDDYIPARPNFHKVLADYQWYSFSEQFGFVRLLLRYRLDLVHFPHFNVPVLYHRPFVVTVHDLILRRYPTKQASTRHALLYWGKVLVYRFVIASALRRAKAIFTVSKFTRSDLLRAYPFLRTRSVTVTYQAAENFCRWKSKESAREMFRGILKRSSALLEDVDTEFPDYLLYVGNAYPHKNLERLVRVFGSANQAGKRLFLVGREDYFYRRLKRVARENHATNCVFVGGVSDDELAVLYRFARGYIFPSLFEGAGLPPLEAMAYGTPVAVSNRTSIPEMVGDAGLFFDPEDENSLRTAIESLWMNDTLREDLQRRGWQRGSHFSWDTLAQQTLEVYQKEYTRESLD